MFVEKSRDAREQRKGAADKNGKGKEGGLIKK